MLNRRVVVQAVIALTASRIAVNMTRRFAYPFLPTIARQMAVPLATAQSIIAVQGSSGLISPLFGPLAERLRRKTVMIGAVLLMAAAAALGAIAPHIGIFAIVMFGFGLGKAIYDPSMYAWMGDNISYNRRGMALGFGELSWALSLFVAAPVAGFLLAQSDNSAIGSLYLQFAGSSVFDIPTSDPSGLRNVMLMFVVLLLIAAMIILRFVPSNAPHPDQASRPVSPIAVLRTLRGHPAALGAIGFAFTLPFANEIIFINYGVFMERSFALTLAVLGTLTIVISIAEVIGEFNVIFLADRLGKRRLTLIGAAVTAVTYIILPFTTASLPLALIVLFVMFVSFETGIVASLSLFTEVMPNDRAIMMSSATGAASLGRVAGATFGGILFSTTSSFLVIGVVALVIGLMAAMLLWLYVPEAPSQEGPGNRLPSS
ncbi:MAG: MFS transporter [Chloroflexota bacterium]